MLILVVEDNRPLAANIVEYLESEGHECDYADRGDQGYLLASDQEFDAIILDIMLPGFDGLTVCQRLRSEGIQTPILMLTARDTLDDKLQGFDVGADDYLVKPFELPELIARLKAIRKRQNNTPAVLQVGDLRVDLSARIAERNGQIIDLNPICWTLLTTLMRASPAVISREKLEAAVWGDQTPDSDALRSHLYQLRKAVDKPFTQPMIHTIRNVGFTLRVTR